MWTVQSPNYPSDYATGSSPGDIVCDFAVKNNYDMSVVDFDVQAGSGGGSCDRDAVQVSDGSTTYDYCNTDNPLYNGGTMDNSMLTMCGANNNGNADCSLKFISDGSGVAKGWKLCQYAPPAAPPPAAPYPPGLPPSPAPPGVMCENTCLDKTGKVNAQTRMNVKNSWCEDGGKGDMDFSPANLKKWGGSSSLEWDMGCKYGTDCDGASLATTPT